MKYACIDIETTGLDRDQCQILELAVVLRDTENMEQPLEESLSFRTYIRHDWYEGEPYAIALNARIFKALADYDNGKEVDAMVYTEEEAVKSLYEFFGCNGYTPNSNDKISFIAAGKNFGSFDLQFLQRMYGWEDHFRVRSRSLDPAMLWLREDDNVPPSLKECLYRAGISKEISHHALEDVYDTIIVLEAGLRKSWNNER